MKGKDTLDKLQGVILACIAFAFYAAWIGYVLSILWAWFLVPLGLPPISIAHAVGLQLLLGYSLRPQPKDDGKPADHFRAIGVGIARSLLVLGVCWIARAFMVGTL